MKFNFLKAFNENFRIKVFASFFVFIFVMSLAYSAVFINDQKKYMTRDLLKNGSLLAGILAHNLRIGVFSENESLLDNPIEAVFQQEGVFEVSVFNHEGELLKNRKKPGSMFIEGSVKEDDGRSAKRILEKLNEISSPYYIEGIKKIEFWSPVISGSNYTMEESLLFQENPLQNKKNIIGLVKVSVDKNMMKKQAIESFIKSVLIGIIFLIVGSGVTYFVSRRITKPLNKLTEGVKALEVGEVFRKVPVETVDEIGRLAKAFNNMSDSLVNRENSLRESEKKYRQLCDALPQVIFEADRFGKLTFANRIAFDLFGYSIEDFRTGLDLHQMLISKDRDRARQNIGRILIGEKLGGHEYTALKKNGSTFPVLIYSSPITIGRTAVGLRGVLVDLSEFKKVQNALLESESRYRDLVENVDDMIWEMNEKSIYTYVSPQSLEVLGYEPEELLGKSPFDFMQPEERKRIREIFLDLLANQRSISELTVESISKEGSLVWLESSATFFTDAEGNFLGIRGVQRNITERIRAERALKESEEKYRVMSENIPVAVYSALPDESSTNLFVSGRIEELTGYTGEEFLKEPRRYENIIHPEDKKYLWEKIEEHRTDQTILDVEYRIITKDHNIKWIRDRGTPTVKDNRVVRIDGFMEDITEKKAAESEIRESREQLRNLSRYLQSSMENERKRISREIHDDLGQYLTALKMDLSWFKRRLPEDQPPLHEKEKSMRRSLDTAIDSVERIVSNLRPGPLEDLGLIAAIEWLIEYFQDQTGITCRYSFDQEEYILDSERAIAIYRILQETLTNIARHSNATEIDIDMCHTGGRIVLKVLDNGIGISKDKVLNPGSFGIMGMQERAYLFQGKVDIEGSRDKGTVITASIPVERYQEL